MRKKDTEREREREVNRFKYCFYDDKEEKR